MRLRTVFSLLLGACFIASALAVSRTLLSQDATSTVRDALNYSSQGQKTRARAMLESQLLDSGVTVGMEEGWDEYLPALDDALQIWSRALGDSPFRPAARSARPDVTVKFVNKLTNSYDVQGRVDATRSFSWTRNSARYKLSGTITVCRLVDWRTLTHDEATEVIAHELGHILGLNDRDEEVGLMGPFVPGRPRLEPTNDELRALFDFRAEVRSALARLR